MCKQPGTRVWVWIGWLAVVAGVGRGAGAVAQGLPAVGEGVQTLVVLPDTEVYMARRPEVFEQMMGWVAEQAGPRRIVGVLHVGDVTNRNTAGEWQAARRGFDRIEGKLPYVLAAGNHDYDGTEGRLTFMNEHFRLPEPGAPGPGAPGTGAPGAGAPGAGAPGAGAEPGGAFEPGKLENHYQFLTIQGRPWLVLSLEMGPRQAVIAWADGVLKRYPDRRAIILTHAFLFYGNQRYDHRNGPQRATPHNFRGEGADGQMLWDQLARKHPGVMIVVCGHLAAAYVGYRADEGDYGNQVHQMMVNYEKLRGGGQGFLRLLEFAPDDSVQVRTYSPVTGGFNPVNPALEEFSFTLRDKTRDQPRPVPDAATQP